MRRMFRYAVEIDDRPHSFALTCRPLAFAAHDPDRGSEAWAEFWTEHTEGAAETEHVYQVLGTGQPIPDGAKWVGTCPRTPLGAVWHLYQVGASDA